ncbi:MAG TPA: hypothetical protein VGJ84_02265 [Polyangiaceae bacterium]
MIKHALFVLALGPCQRPSDTPLPPKSRAETTSDSTTPPEPSPTTKKWTLALPPTVATDWCVDSTRALDEDTCYVLPGEPTSTLLIYLHGIVPPAKDSYQKTHFETVVANAARRARAAALIPRGKQGLAPKGFAGWWGWPTSEVTYRANASELVPLIERKRRRLEQALGVEFSRVYLAGSSAGAYFAAALALHGAFHADGFGAMSGGAGWQTPELQRLEPKPFYIGYGASDSVRSAALALAALLRRSGWPVRVAEHAVPHGAQEIYLDEAFAFWREHAP